MPEPKHIVIVAGEASGDQHAASFVEKLKAQQPDLIFSGIGGLHMQEAGVELLSDLARVGVTGLVEILRHFRTIRQAFLAIKKHLRQTKPDLLILVDYPGFNLRLAKFAKKELGLNIIYYISPQIWAWKASRIKLIREVVDHMAVILPFEKEIYQQAGVKASFVGHPLVDKVQPCLDVTLARKNLNLPLNKKIIALLPGSRINEIKQHMPVLLQAAQKLTLEYPDVHIVVPVALNLDPLLVSHYFKNSPLRYTLLKGQAILAASCSDAIVVASGTASLECALLEKPMCIIYKTSFVTYLVAMKFIRVRYLGLCNLLKNAMVVPELLQYDCNAKELTLMLKQLLTNAAVFDTMKDELSNLKASLSNEQADCSIVDLITNQLRLKNVKHFVKAT